MMEIKAYYNAYGERVYLGNLYEEGGHIVFEYSEAFKKKDINVLPLFRADIFDKIYGENGSVPCLFFDNEFSGYTAELLSRILETNETELSVLKKLTMSSRNNIGAIEFEPSLPFKPNYEVLDLDAIEDDIRKYNNLSKLYRLNSSINGHTPKISAKVSKDKKTIMDDSDDNSFEDWIIKIPRFDQNFFSGRVEFIYHAMAKTAKLNVAPAYLFPSIKCPGYFGVKRFDRVGGQKVHVLSAGALANKNSLKERMPLSEYVKVLRDLNADDLETEKLIRILAFNLKTGNDDIRGTNISFMLENNRDWKVAPAYDLVPDAINGEVIPAFLSGKQSKEEIDGIIYDLGKTARFEDARTSIIIEEIEQAIQQYSRLINEAA